MRSLIAWLLNIRAQDYEHTSVALSVALLRADGSLVLFTTSERDTPEWRLAIQMLIDAAENRGPVLFARMGIERADGRRTAQAGARSMKRHRSADRRFHD